MLIYGFVLMNAVMQYIAVWMSCAFAFGRLSAFNGPSLNIHISVHLEKHYFTSDLINLTCFVVYIFICYISNCFPIMMPQKFYC